MKKQDLINQAAALVGDVALNSPCKDNSAGCVATALLTKDGNVYTGICLVMQCGIGFCAEHAAVAEMMKHHETEIKMIVSVKKEGKIIPPCGRCRELLYQINKNNLKTQVIIDAQTTLPLKELLPHPWKG